MDIPSFHDEIPVKRAKHFLREAYQIQQATHCPLISPEYNHIKYNFISIEILIEIKTSEYITISNFQADCLYASPGLVL